MYPDPDPEIACNLMQGREPLLALCRENNYEFSSQRRALHSSMMVLYKLHTDEGSDSYTCNKCAKPITAMECRYHCIDGCDDFDLCKNCFTQHGHEHKMDQVGIVTSAASQNMSAEEQKRETLKKALIALNHAINCTNPQCSVPGCIQVTKMISHTQSCGNKGRQCQQCRPLLILVCHHAKVCHEANCKVPFCEYYKLRMRQSKVAKLRDQVPPI